MTVRLGPFEINTRFATGGMGEVWTGSHVESGTPVAIKVITGPNALLPEYKAEFRREVQAVAKLHHPNIVQVFDYGVLSEEARELGGGLLPGAPYLVMEYASRGSLADQVEPLNWRDLKNILMAVLGGLAHAHARGVIHRDIKPGNVLLGSHHESPPRIILTDFGVAHATDSVTRTDAVEFTSRSTEEASGTPRYMAPEQFMGRWRDYGPATDLYAVGIMAYHLACGELPFQGATFMLLAMAHINNPFPPLKPIIDAPDGFEEWIQRLTHKQPHDRFQSAANAAWALTQLDDSALLFSELSNIMGEPSEWSDEDDDYDTDMLPTRIDFALPEAIRVFTMSKSSREGKYKDVPPLPLTWQEAEPPEAQISLVGSGLGLFGLRNIPLVGREPERTKIWDVFKDAHTHRKGRAVVIRGLAGTGKSRLVEWFFDLVDEIGAASTFNANHSANPGPMHGIGFMLTRHLRAAGLSGDDMRDRVQAVCERHGIDDEPTVMGVVEMMRADLRETSATATSQMVRFNTPDQRYELIRKLLEATMPERPLAFWMDDVQWEADTIDFARWWLENPGADSHPGLFVLTVREEDIGLRADARASLQALCEREDVLTIELEALSDHLLTDLVREYLYLPVALAREVAQRASGSPLFAIQLVQDWVKRGVLEVEGSQFVVRRGETLEMPADVTALWTGTLESLIQTLTTIVDDETTRRPISADSARASIEVAAALGQDVNFEEWLHACQMAGYQVDRAVVDELVRFRLATQSEEGFSFVNRQLRELITTQGKEADRWIAHNMLAARMLTTRYGEDLPGLAQRVGRHFLAANAVNLALTCLEEAYQRAQGTADQRDLNEIIELIHECYEEMGLPEDDIRRAELGVRRAVSKIYSQDPEVFDEGVQLLERSEEIARGAGHKRFLAGILRARAWALIFAEEPVLGLELAREALQLSAGKKNMEASVHRTIGHLLLLQGKVEEARAELQKTLELAPRSVHAIWATQQLAAACIMEEELDEAEALLRKALSQAEDRGVLMVEAQVWETWAFVAEHRGNYEVAEERHRTALKLRASISSDSTLHAQSREYLARTLIHLKQYEQALEILNALQARVDGGARLLNAHFADAFLACAAGTGDWDEWAERFEGAFDFRGTRLTFQHATILLAAANLARNAGQYALARDAYEWGAETLDEHGIAPNVAMVMRAALSEIADRPDFEDREAGVDSGARFPAVETEEYARTADENNYSMFPDSSSGAVLTSAPQEFDSSKVQVISAAEATAGLASQEFDGPSEGYDDGYDEDSDGAFDDDDYAEAKTMAFSVFEVPGLANSFSESDEELDDLDHDEPTTLMEGSGLLDAISHAHHEREDGPAEDPSGFEEPSSPETDPFFSPQTLTVDDAWDEIERDFEEMDSLTLNKGAGIRKRKKSKDS